MGGSSSSAASPRCSRNPRTNTRHACFLTRRRSRSRSRPLFHDRRHPEGEKPLNTELIVTCAVTGAGDTVGRHPAVPVTPKQIAEAVIEAANAGAAVTHIHVRDPKTGKGGRHPDWDREVVERVRGSRVDVIINLSAGMGGDYVVGDPDPLTPGEGTDLVGALERLKHVEELLPEICTLDCGTLNYGDGNLTYISTPAMLRTAARRVQQLGVKPELECFDTGHVWLARQMHAEGLLADPPLFQLCLGIPYGAPADTNAMKAMRDELPEGAVWAAFGIGRHQMPMVAQAGLVRGGGRGGVAGKLYLREGGFARQGPPVEDASPIIAPLRAPAPTAGAAGRH